MKPWSRASLTSIAFVSTGLALSTFVVATGARMTTALASAVAKPGGTAAAREHAAADDHHRISKLLEASNIVDFRPNVRGYDRECSPGAACVFGPAWTDDTTAPDGHNGCDTRNDVLRETLADVRFKQGSHGCDVVAGWFVDPYLGRRMDYAQEGSQIQVDHLFPLAAAWDLGASSWTLAKRERFANDTARELLAVDGQANQSKGDSTPSSWLPPDKAGRCSYMRRYLVVANYYRLSITRADARVIRAAARKC